MTWKQRLLKFIVYFFVISILSVIIFRWLPIPFTLTMVNSTFEQMFSGNWPVWKKDWVSYDKISRHMPVAVVCAEDQKFLDHEGFDFEAINKAIKYNEKMKARNKERRKGASTISQQTAKNVFLWQGRSWLRKGLEVYFTFLIEIFWSKKRIMEVYLNVIEFGNGIYGVEAASKQFFKTSASKLSREQAALLAVCLPNPHIFKVNRPSIYVKKRQNWAMRQMAAFGKLEYE
jgi:monofunctional biosynthetic peptidoglycan transglycosylase